MCAGGQIGHSPLVRLIMNGDTPRQEYSCSVTRRGDEWVASIPELCVLETRSTPEEALAAALRSEAQVRSTMDRDGIPLPPSAAAEDPLPQLTGFFRAHRSFVAKLVVGYVLVLGMTAFLVGIAAQTGYLRAVLTRLGISD